MRTAVYSSTGDTLTHYDLDVDACTLTVRAALQMPSTVQYGAVHPSNRYLYVVTTDSERGSPTITGAVHALCAMHIGPDGTLAIHGAPARLGQRAIHTSVDGTGSYLFCCYNAPPRVTVHHINEDGSVGAEIGQQANLDLGFFPHQIQTTPSNHAVLVPARGHNPSLERPNGNPGALKLFSLREGQLSNLVSIAPGRRGGFGYGPRHVSFHPSKPWVYVLVELQNQLHMHRIVGDVPEAEPVFIKPLTEFAPQPSIRQVGGAIHVHPHGHVVYASNRVSATTHPDGPFPFVGGENNIAVFSIDTVTGEPTPIQFVDPHGFHIRSFTVDPSGQILIAASLAPMTVKIGNKEQIVPAGLSLFRIGLDGSLKFVRKYDIELTSGVQHMWVQAVGIGE